MSNEYIAIAMGLFFGEWAVLVVITVAINIFRKMTN